ncbi:hypothetical protein OG352_17460 [Streptomyces sp. NBC_01485]|uniref:hypothetical protein n=1 Tax=Streptomyces sp. NBC_01485 TaxID=2903884 RepID=UPI002E32860B|nr:hypothetical protein [Streptomyces sp. NBC_01485]
MSESVAERIDADTIWSACRAADEIFGRCPEKRSAVLDLGKELRGYIDVLLPKVMVLAPRMRGEMRRVAIHALVRGRQVVAELDQAEPVPVEAAPLDGKPDMRDRDAAFEMAIVCRSYLSLVTRPGPLGEPIGMEEIEVAVKRRLCGACWRPIADGELVEVKVYTSDSGPDFHGFIHAEPCIPYRPVLVRVPVQPAPA